MLTCTTDSMVQGFTVRPHGHGEERPSTRSEKQHLSVKQCLIFMVLITYIHSYHVETFVHMHTWELLFLPLFLRKLLVSTRSSPRKLSYLAFHSTASNRRNKYHGYQEQGLQHAAKARKRLQIDVQRHLFPQMSKNLLVEWSEDDRKHSDEDSLRKN